MTYGAGTPDDFISLGRAYSPRKSISHTVSGAFALAMSLLAGGSILYIRFATGPSVEDAIPVRKTHKAPKASSAGKTTVFGSLEKVPAFDHPDKTAPIASLDVASMAYGRLLDPSFSLGATPVPLGRSVPLAANFAPISPLPSAAVAEIDSVLPLPDAFEKNQNTPLPTSRPSAFGLAEDETAPLPAPRPAELGPASHAGVRTFARRFRQQDRTAVAATMPSDRRSFFEKIFGRPQQPSSGPVLAYAAPEDGVLDNQRSTPSHGVPGVDRWTAVYDISAHTVYMPDGTRLEAHSGLGGMMDDPHYVKERMRGATPPNVYELTPREQLFHGVQALRLNPVGGTTFGRTGLLAHSYMLGPYGASNGCVSFRNYNAFLQAYKRGEIRRLVVVAGLN